jgi:hypothetical protein
MIPAIVSQPALNWLAVALLFGIGFTTGQWAVNTVLGAIRRPRSKS